MNTTESRTKLKSIRADLDKALSEIAKNHGLKDFHSAGAKFTTGGSFDFKVEGLFNDGLSKEEERYDNSRDVLSLPARGSIYTDSKGKKFSIFGLNTTASKVIIESLEDHRRYIIMTDAIAVAAKIGRIAPS